MKYGNEMADEERLFLLEHKSNYYIPNQEDHSDYRIREIISSNIYDHYDGLCEVYPMLFDKHEIYDHEYKISCTVILQFKNSHDVNMFKIKYMSELDNIVEIKS